MNATLGNLLELLRSFHPVIAGTYPLGIQVDGSDIDILCEVPDLGTFETFLAEHPEWFESARRSPVEHVEPAACAVELEIEDLKVEVFAQPLPIHRQIGFRHMVVEGRLLAEGGPPLAEAIRKLKSQGHKTEPAFAKVLGLEGDPYKAVLELESADAAELRRLVERFLERSP